MGGVSGQKSSSGERGTKSKEVASPDVAIKRVRLPPKVFIRGFIGRVYVLQRQAVCVFAAPFQTRTSCFFWGLLLAYIGFSSGSRAVAQLSSAS